MIDFVDGFASQSGEILAYLFDVSSGEFIGKGLVHVSEGCALAPGQTLDRPPRTKKGHAVVRADEQWSVLEDHRGVTYSTRDGQSLLHEELGPLPDDRTVLPRPSEFHRWSEGAWELDGVALAKSECKKAIAQAEALLASTDWYVIRQQETGEAIPTAVLSNRKDARTLISTSREQGDV